MMFCKIVRLHLKRGCWRSYRLSAPTSPSSTKEPEEPFHAALSFIKKINGNARENDLPVWWTRVSRVLSVNWLRARRQFYHLALAAPLLGTTSVDMLCHDCLKQSWIFVQPPSRPQRLTITTYLPGCDDFAEMNKHIDTLNNKRCQNIFLKNFKCSGCRRTPWPYCVLTSHELWKLSRTHPV